MAVLKLFIIFIPALTLYLILFIRTKYRVEQVLICSIISQVLLPASYPWVWQLQYLR